MCATCGPLLTPKAATNPLARSSLARLTFQWQNLMDSTEEWVPKKRSAWLRPAEFWSILSCTQSSSRNQENNVIHLFPLRASPAAVCASLIKDEITSGGLLQLLKRFFDVMEHASYMHAGYVFTLGDHMTDNESVLTWWVESGVRVSTASLQTTLS